MADATTPFWKIDGEELLGSNGEVLDIWPEPFWYLAPSRTKYQRGEGRVRPLEFASVLHNASVSHGLPRVIARLRQREESLSQDQASALITAFALNGNLLPRERGMMVWTDTRAKAGMLIAGLLRQVPAGELRQPSYPTHA